MTKLIILPFILLFLAGWFFSSLLLKFVQLVFSVAAGIVLFLFVGVAMALRKHS